MVEGEGFALKLKGKGSNVDGEWRTEVRTRGDHASCMSSLKFKPIQCIRDRKNKLYCTTVILGLRVRGGEVRVGPVWVCMWGMIHWRRSRAPSGGCRGGPKKSLCTM